VVAAGHRFASLKILRFEPLSIRRKDELRLSTHRGRTRLQRSQRLRHLAGAGDRDMDVVSLQYTAKVRLLRLPLPQPLERGLLVPEGLEEGEGKLGPIERALGQRGEVRHADDLTECVAKPELHRKPDNSPRIASRRTPPVITTTYCKRARWAMEPTKPYWQVI
jgi:hypothetical protein